MFKKWNGELDEEELSVLHEGRQYVVFYPSPEDETTFSVKVVDTTEASEEYNEEFPNVSVVVVKGIMHMLDFELEYLVERGVEFMQGEVASVQKDKFKNSDNVIVFSPKTRKDQ
jgi:hypothetical protein|tara:strand:- start:474 stop:815 length:342 start_codon:yes stop_codon:yes gene_type:complete